MKTKPTPPRRWAVVPTCLLAASLAAWPGDAAAGLQPAAEPPPRLLLAGTFGAHLVGDVSAWLASEKLDGVRAHWDGRRLRTRNGHVIAAPRWFIERLPAVPLDGELWLGRGRFDALSAIVRSATPDDTAWSGVRYMVFELPGASGNFEQRSRQIEALVERVAWPSLQAVRQHRLPDRAGLQRMFDAVVAAGGEGLMLHLAAAPYVTGRSDVLVKLKPEIDAEAVVVAHKPGRGRLGGRLGALQLQRPDGRRFWLGSGFSDDQRLDPPAVGSVVTYRYRDLTPSGLPRFASFVRVRPDL